MVQIPVRVEIWLKNSAPSAPLAISAMMSTLTVHCQWEDEAVRAVKNCIKPQPNNRYII